MTDNEQIVMCPHRQAPWLPPCGCQPHGRDVDLLSELIGICRGCDESWDSCNCDGGPQ